MTLPLPRLDDRTWQDLRDEAVSLIPRYAPTWTDHNVTDPGITLLELLAYYTEQELFRLDQISDAHRQAILLLLGRERLPHGPRPACTLLAYEPNSGAAPDTTFILKGTYFVPRLAPHGRGTPQPKELGGPNLFDIKNSALYRSPLREDENDERAPDVPEFGFRAAHDLDLTNIRLASVQSFDGTNFRDLSDLIQQRGEAPVWGTNPQATATQQPALYFGFDLGGLRKNSTLGEVEDRALTIWAFPSADLQRVSMTDIMPMEPHPTAFQSPHQDVSGPRADVPTFDPKFTPPAHHGLTVCWEYLSAGHWLPIPPGGSFRDDTRAFTRPGRIVLPLSVFYVHLPATTGMTATAAVAMTRTDEALGLGAVADPLFYVRCRLVAGRPDVAPTLRGLSLDTVLVEQFDRTTTRHRVGDDRPATLGDLLLTHENRADLDDAVTEFRRRGWGNVAPNWPTWPLWNRYGFAGMEREKTPDYTEDRLQAVVLGVGDGRPLQAFALPAPFANTYLKPLPPDEEFTDPPLRVVTDTLRVWVLEPTWGWTPPRRGATPPPEQPWHVAEWTAIPDFALSTRNGEHYRMVPSVSTSRYESPGSVTFGDGEYGRAPAPGAVILASYSWTVAEAANFAVGYTWARTSEIDRTDPQQAVVRHPVLRFRNVLPAQGGTPSETLAAAVNRLAAEFAAPNRLVEWAEQAKSPTLDGLDVAAFTPPLTAVTLLDLEHLARTIPGTHVERARAWAEIDPRYPDQTVEGSVTIIIVPALPTERPMPTPGLLQTVHNYLWARRSVTSRLIIRGPEYTVVRVRATVHTNAERVARVRQEATDTIQAFLHPLRGGPTQRGWPFGRAVYPGELLALLAQVRGVQYVDGLRLATATGAWGEQPIDLPPRALVDLHLDLDVQGDV